MGAGADAKRTALSAMERILNLEKDVKGLVGAIGNTMTGVQEQFERQSELLSAIVDQIGNDVLTKIINDKRVANEKKEVDRAKAALEDQLAKGTMVPAETITEMSVVCAYESNPDGSPVGFIDGYKQLLLSNLSKDLQEKLLGQMSGITVETENGGKFTVSNIYEIIKKEVDPEALPPEGNSEDA